MWWVRTGIRETFQGVLGGIWSWEQPALGSAGSLAGREERKDVALQVCHWCDCSESKRNLVSSTREAQGRLCGDWDAGEPWLGVLCLTVHVAGAGTQLQQVQRQGGTKTLQIFGLGNKNWGEENHLPPPPSKRSCVVAPARCPAGKGVFVLHGFGGVGG